MPSWEVCVERISISAEWAPEPECLEIRYRRYEVKPFGVMPLTDDEWAAGHFEDVTPFGTVGQRHYLRVTDGADA
jgi:hypothetical protein